MKKLFALLVALVLFPCCVVAESLTDYEIHQLFKGLTRRDVINLIADIDTEIHYRTGESTYCDKNFHEEMKGLTTEELAAIKFLAYEEIDYMNNFVNRMEYAVENGGFFLPDNITSDLIRFYFENNGFTVVSVAKRDGLKDGKEQYTVILDSADIGIVSTINGMIEYYDGELWHTDIPLY